VSPIFGQHLNPYAVGENCHFLQRTHYEGGAKARIMLLCYDPEFEPILKKWGSEKAVHAFLKKEFDRINRAVFGGNLEMPELQIKPMEPDAPRTLRIGRLYF
jgi:hypothetical protein